MIGRVVGFLCLLILAAGCWGSSYVMVTGTYQSYLEWQDNLSMVGPMILWCAAMIALAVAATYSAFHVLFTGEVI